VSERDPEELPPDVRALLDEEASRAEPSERDVERIRDGALREIVRRAPAAGTSGAPSRVVRAPLWFTSGLLVGALLVGALWRRSPSRTVVLNNIVVVHVDAARSMNASAIDSAPVDEATRAATDSEAAPPLSSLSTSGRGRSSRDAGSERPDLSLRAERELIETAQNALARRQFRDAIGACEAHLRRFARAQLVEEREAIWVQALAGDGRRADAWARAESFRRRFPASMLRTIVDRAAPAVPGRDE
jgi:hypothetical protein